MTWHQFLLFLTFLKCLMSDPPASASCLNGVLSSVGEGRGTREEQMVSLLYTFMMGNWEWEIGKLVEEEQSSLESS